MLLEGRKKIFTDVKHIDRTNVVKVLQKAYGVHQENANDIQLLMFFEQGKQPLQRVKTIRPDIDIRVNSGLPNYIKKFKLGYHWGNPIMLIQRGDKELHGKNGEDDDLGISALNEILKNGENIAYKDQQMGEFIEISGIGHRMVWPRDFPENSNQKDESLVNVFTLDSRFTFMVYYDGPGQKELMGVTYAKRKNRNVFTCFTEDAQFEISGEKILSEMPNIMGGIPIVEYERTFDRTGCFERHIPAINALNILESDFTNDVAQRTQEIWWGDNVSFTDEEGKESKPQSGDWVLTRSDSGSAAKIAPLSSTFQGDATLNAINSRRTTILQECYVPIQYESSGGGSTGVATDMASGWSAAELDALQEQQMTERGKRKELKLVLQALKFVPERVLPSESPLRKVHVSDIELKFLRKKNSDMSIKANTFATLVSHGVHGRHAMEYIDAFTDTEQTWIDSKDGVEALQKTIYEKSTNENLNNNSASDTQNQTENSPIIDKV